MKDEERAEEAEKRMVLAASYAATARFYSEKMNQSDGLRKALKSRFYYLESALHLLAACAALPAPDPRDVLLREWVAGSPVDQVTYNLPKCRHCQHLVDFDGHTLNHAPVCVWIRTRHTLGLAVPVEFQYGGRSILHTTS